MIVEQTSSTNICIVESETDVSNFTETEDKESQFQDTTVVEMCKSVTENHSVSLSLNSTTVYSRLSEPRLSKNSDYPNFSYVSHNVLSVQIVYTTNGHVCQFRWAIISDFTKFPS